jgi:hypothetical protein
MARCDQRRESSAATKTSTLVIISVAGARVGLNSSLTCVGPIKVVAGY